MAGQIYKFVAPGLYKHERGAFLPYLIATPFFFVLGSMLVYFVVLPMLVRFSLGMQQIGGSETAQIELLPKVGEYLSLMMSLIFAFGVAFQLPVILTLLGPDRHHHLEAAAREAALFHRGRLHHRRRPDAARRHQPGLARACRCCCSTKARSSRLPWWRRRRPPPRPLPAGPSATPPPEGNPAE